MKTSYLANKFIPVSTIVILIGLFCKFIEFFSVKIELVGLTINLATIGWPEEIPPNSPPE